MTDFYTDLAATLHSIADDFAALAGRDLPDLAPLTLYVQPATGLSDVETAAVVDAIAAALIGELGEVREMASGNFHHTAGGMRGAVSIRVFGGIEPPSRVSKLGPSCPECGAVDYWLPGVLDQVCPQCGHAAPRAAADAEFAQWRAEHPEVPS